MIIGVGTLLAWIAADLRHTLHEVFPALLLVWHDLLGALQQGIGALTT